MAFELNPHQLPFVGQFFTDPAQKALTAQFQQLADTYKQYRGFAADTREAQLGSQIQNMGPELDYLYKMYPSMQHFDTTGAYNQFANSADSVKQNAVAAAPKGATGGQGPALTYVSNNAKKHWMADGSYPDSNTQDGAMDMTGSYKWDRLNQTWLPYNTA